MEPDFFPLEPENNTHNEHRPGRGGDKRPENWDQNGRSSWFDHNEFDQTRELQGDDYHRDHNDDHK